jgi:hypothetical protein
VISPTQGVFLSHHVAINSIKLIKLINQAGLIVDKSAARDFSFEEATRQ